MKPDKLSETQSMTSQGVEFLPNSVHCEELELRF